MTCAGGFGRHRGARCGVQAGLTDQGHVEVGLRDPEITQRLDGGVDAGDLRAGIGEQFEDADDNPLSTKLALAQEFRAIGDIDGARSMASEVVAEATGTLKVRAERFLAEL